MVSISNRDQDWLGSEFGNRKIYRKPLLKKLGDLRALTLGGSPGVGDSSNGTTEFPPGGGPTPGSYPGPGGFPPTFPPKGP
jgi:hypothetical protein